MKFRFSLQWLFIVTTAVSVLMAIAMWLGLHANDWRILAAFGLYFLIYLSIVGVLLGPRYLREFKEFQTLRSQQKLIRDELETETQKSLEMIKANKVDRAAQDDEADRS